MLKLVRKNMFLKYSNFGNKNSLVIFTTLSFLIILKRIIINETNWDIIVAIPIPLTPKAGINKKPKIKIGLSITFKRNDKIKTLR